MHVICHFIFINLVFVKEYEHAWLVLFGVLFAIGLIFVFLFWRIIKYGRKIVDAKQIRVAAESICVWNFSPEEWLEYAAAASFVNEPKGSGEIKITVYDIWIKDENGTRSQSLNSSRLVTDCRVDAKGIKVRRRSMSQYSPTNAPVYKVSDLYIPVPRGKEVDAAKIVDELKAFIARHSDKVAEVTPPDVITGLLGEVDF